MINSTLSIFIYINPSSLERFFSFLFLWLSYTIFIQSISHFTRLVYFKWKIRIKYRGTIEHSKKIKYIHRVVDSSKHNINYLLSEDLKWKKEKKTNIFNDLIKILIQCSVMVTWIWPENKLHARTVLANFCLECVIIHITYWMFILFFLAFSIAT